MQPTRNANVTASFGLSCRGWRILVSGLTALAVFVALFHGLRAVADPASPVQASVITLAADTSPDLPDQPGHGAHCGHCLCHSGFHAVAGAGPQLVLSDASICTVHEDRLTRPIASLPPFKPPRA